MHMRQMVRQAIKPDFLDKDIMAFFSMPMVSGLARLTGRFASRRFKPFINSLTTVASQGLERPRRR